MSIFRRPPEHLHLWRPNERGQSHQSIRLHQMWRDVDKTIGGNLGGGGATRSLPRDGGVEELHGDLRGSCLVVSAHLSIERRGPHHHAERRRDVGAAIPVFGCIALWCIFYPMYVAFHVSSRKSFGFKPIKC